MSPTETIANSIATLITSGLVSFILNTVREKRKWGLKTHVFLSAVSLTGVYIVLVFCYVNILRPSHVWRKLFYPETVSIEGSWLQIKKFTPGLLAQANTLAEGDISKFPYSILTLYYDKKEEGDYMVEGITASDSQFFRFRSNRVWTKLDDQNLFFTYTADLGDSTVGGLTEIVFYPTPDGSYVKGTGKFIDDRGFRIDFDLEKLDTSMVGQDLRDPAQQIEHIRSLQKK